MRRAYFIIAVLAGLSAFAAEPGAESLARASRKESDLCVTGKPVAEQHAQKALELARAAIAADAGSAQAHLSAAIAYGKLTDFVGAKTRFEYGKIIGDEARRATELDPKNDLAWHVLGRWHHGLSEVSGIERALCKAVFGGLPAASYDEAVACFQKAIAIAPARIMHHAELARTFTAQKKTALASAEWEQVLKLSAVDDEDRAYQREARK